MQEAGTTGGFKNQ